MLPAAVARPTNAPHHSIGDKAADTSIDICGMGRNCLIAFSMMRMIAKYREFGQFCEDQAKATNDAERRELFEAMAAEWRRIARAYEGLLRRIAPIGKEMEP